jgi:hypothetical protein
MKRAYWVYIFMTITLVVGLWVILALGANVVAPADLAGRWELIPVDEETATPAEMLVEQSGRYFQLRLGEEVHHLVLRQQQRSEEREEHELFMELADRGTTAIFRGPYRGKVYEFELSEGDQSRR